MKNLDLISEELFNKIRGRFPSVTIGDAEGKVTNKPNEARFFDFDYLEGEQKLGRVSISLTDESVQVMYSNDFVANEDSITRDNWYNFLKELRAFSKKRLLQFDTRNINKSNLDLRDYKFLATNRTGDDKMNESKMYGTSKTSYQNFGEARVSIKHSKPVNQESATGRITNISSIFIESPEGEKFKYPFKHINGARAMARHVAEGGNPYDDFGKHITGLSEELASLKKFKSYVNRSSVMAEGLSGYMLPVNERLKDIKKTISSLQKESTYKTMIENFESTSIEEVPNDVAENWIDQLTIKQFNEELKDVFPFVYRLVSEATKAKELGPDDLAEERVDEIAPIILGLLGLAGAGYAASKLMPTAKDAPLGRALQIACEGGDSDACKYYKNLDAYVDANDTETLEMLVFTYVKEPYGDFENVPMEGIHNDSIDLENLLAQNQYEDQIDSKFEDVMGQFAEGAEMNEDETEGNAYAHAVRKAKMNGKKKGDEIEGPDGEKITIENVTEFVLSMYDRETGQFPKGETAVLTAVEKDYGEQYINPAKQFIEMINAKFEEFNGYKDPELMDGKKMAGGTDFDHYMGKTGNDEYDELMANIKKIEGPRSTGSKKIRKRGYVDIDGYGDDDPMESSGLQYYTGVKKHGKEYMKKAAQAGREGASQEELGRLKDKYSKAEKNKATKETSDLRKLAGL